MASRPGNVANSIQQSLGIPPGTKFFSPYPFNGMNLLDAPPSIGDSEFVWVENFIRLGNGNLRTGWDIGRALYTASSPRRIVYFTFFTLGTNYYAAVFLDDGSAVQVAYPSGAVTTIGPAGTFYVLGADLPATAQWGTQFLLISNRNTTNDYWIWDGKTLFGAGGAQPESVIILSGGSGYTSLPTVTPFGGSGTGMVVVPTVEGGSVTDLHVTNPGTGYEVGDIVQLAFSGGGSDSSAILQALINSSGVAAVSVTSGGTGYTSATVTFSGGGGSGAAGTVIIGSGVSALNLTASGSGYTGATVTFSGGGGSGATATAVVIGGQVSSLTLQTPGSGYTSAPTVTIHGDGTGATATATIQNGVITGVTMTNPGTGYTSAPSVSFSGTGTGATGVTKLSAGGVTGVTVVNAGSGFTSAPSVTFVGGGGTGATGIAELVGTSVVSINVVAGGVGYQDVPTVKFVGGGAGSGATASVTLAQGQVVSIQVTNGGSGYTTQPEVVIEPFTSGSGSSLHVDPGTGASAQAVLAPTGIGGVIISSSGRNYTSAPAVEVGSTGNNAAYATVPLMPFGVSGAAMTTYQQRVWIGNPAPGHNTSLPPGGNFSVSAPGSFADFATSDGGVDFTNSDGFLQTKYTAFHQSNGYLYAFGDGSVSIISSVNTTGNPATTTFNYQNVDPQTGAPFPNSLQDFGKTILFANEVGVYGLYGGSAAQASQKLNSLFEGATFGGSGVTPSAATVTLHGIKHYALLMTITDPYFASSAKRTVMATWNEKDWVITSQSVDLAFIGTQKIGSKLFAWGTDGTQLVPLFAKPSASLPKRLITKQYGGANTNFIVKQLNNQFLQAQDQAGSGISCLVDILSSGMATQPADPELQQLLSVDSENPWIATAAFNAAFPYWQVFATRNDPGIPFFVMSARLETTSADFILANWAFAYIDYLAHIG